MAIPHYPRSRVTDSEISSVPLLDRKWSPDQPWSRCSRHGHFVPGNRTSCLHLCPAISGLARRVPSSWFAKNLQHAIHQYHPIAGLGGARFYWRFTIAGYSIAPDVAGLEAGHDSCGGSGNLAARRRSGVDERVFCRRRNLLTLSNVVRAGFHRANLGLCTPPLGRYPGIGQGGRILILVTLQGEKHDSFDHSGNSDLRRR